MKFNCDLFAEKAGLEYPVIGLYDTDDVSAFEPLVSPKEGRWACTFMYFNSWQKGASLHLTPENFGCGGASTYFFEKPAREREDFIDFLYCDEGLKASRELTGDWVDKSPKYKRKNDNIIIGPLKDEKYDDLKTVTFFVNPDQLSLFITAGYYNQGVSQPRVVTAPFASGCGQLAGVFDDLEKPEAIIGASDIAMRKYLPKDILAFTVTKPMYEQICAIDASSFLEKPFWQGVVKHRSAN